MQQSHGEQTWRLGQLFLAPEAWRGIMPELTHTTVTVHSAALNAKYARTAAAKAIQPGNYRANPRIGFPLFFFFFFLFCFFFFVVVLWEGCGLS